MQNLKKELDAHLKSKYKTNYKKVKLLIEKGNKISRDSHAQLVLLVKNHLDTLPINTQEKLNLLISIYSTLLIPLLMLIPETIREPYLAQLQEIIKKIETSKLNSSVQDINLELPQNMNTPNPQINEEREKRSFYTG